jgi:hypothetical protein
MSVYDLNTLTEETMPKEKIVYLFFRLLIIAHRKSVNEEVLILFEQFKDEFYKSEIFLRIWDLGLYYLLTSSDHFSPETYKKLIKLTKELGVKIMSETSAVKFYEVARNEGRAEGRTEGRTKGRTEGIANSVIWTLGDRFEEPSARLKQKIMKFENEDKLRELLRFANTCVSIGEFETIFN